MWKPRVMLPEKIPDERHVFLAVIQPMPQGPAKPDLSEASRDQGSQPGIQLYHFRLQRKLPEPDLQDFPSKATLELNV